MYIFSSSDGCCEMLLISAKFPIILYESRWSLALYYNVKKEIYLLYIISAKNQSETAAWIFARFRYDTAKMAAILEYNMVHETTSHRLTRYKFLIISWNFLHNEFSILPFMYWCVLFLLFYTNNPTIFKESQNKIIN